MQKKDYMTYGTAAKLSLGISMALFIFFILSHYFRQLLRSPEEIPPSSPHELIILVVFAFAMISLLLFILFVTNFRILRSDIPRKRKTLTAILASVAVALTYSIIMSLLIKYMLPPRPEHGPNPFVWVGVIRDLLMATIVIFISQILYLTQKRQQVELKNEMLEAENVRTRYQALKSQVNPHFLFNTLSTLDSMVETEPAKAREYIQKLSSIFRYTLKNKDVVTLSEELDFTRNYSDLMQIRHGDNLKILVNTDRRYNDYLVVPMAVQGLVENAVKHNSFSDSRPLAIIIETNENGLLTVSNRLQPREYPEPGEGLGLANLSERYRLKWQEEISIESVDGIFKVTLPLIPQAD